MTTIAVLYRLISKAYRSAFAIAAWDGFIEVMGNFNSYGPTLTL
jgi:hypothetical protein